MADFNDLDVDQLRALLNKNSDSVDETAETSKDALVNAPSQSARSGPDWANNISDYINDKAPSSAVNNMVAQASGQGTPTDAVPVAPAGSTDVVPDDQVAKNTGLSPSVDDFFSKLTQPARDAMDPQTDSRQLASDGTDDSAASPAAAKLKAALMGPSAPGAATAIPTPDATTPQSNPNDPFNPQALQAAQANQRLLTGLSGLADAGGTIGAALSRGAYKNDSDYFNNFNKTVAPQGVNNLLARQKLAEDSTAHQLKQYALADEKEKNDPNSSVSSLARNVLQASAKQAGFNVGDVSKMSASSIEKTAPWVAKIIDAKMSADARASQMAMSNMYRQDKMDDMRQKNIQNLVQKASDQINPNKARSGNLAGLQTQLNGADRLQALALDPQGGIRNLNPQQMGELSIAMNRLVSGQSGGSVESLKAIMPHDAMLSGANALQWFTSNPQGAGQQAFTKMMLDTADRERAVTQTQLRNAQYGGLVPVERNIMHAKGMSEQEKQEAMRDILVSQQLDPEEYNSYKGGKPKNAVQQGISAQSGTARNPQGAPAALTQQDQQAIQWAQANKTDPRAAKILALHGMK